MKQLKTNIWKFWILSLLMLACMMVSTPVQAEEAEIPYWEKDDNYKDHFREKDGIVYYVRLGNATVHEIITTEPEVYIPEMYEEYPVTKFVCDIPGTLKVIHLPKTVETYSTSLSWDYSSDEMQLKEILVDEESEYFTSVDGVLYNKAVTELVRAPYAKKTVNIPDTVTVIRHHAFMDNQIKKVVLPDSVKRIGKSAFYFCDNLKSIKLPKNLKKISYYAFYRCVKLKKITVPASVNKIEKCAFLGCNDLEKVKFAKGSKLKVVDGFLGCDSLKSIEIPEGVTKIEWEAFASCEKLERVVIPASMKTIDWYAFQNCKKLKSVTIYSDTVSIGARAFKGVGKKLKLKVKPNSSAYHFAVKKGIKYQII